MKKEKKLKKKFASLLATAAIVIPTGASMAQYKELFNYPQNQEETANEEVQLDTKSMTDQTFTLMKKVQQLKAQRNADQNQIAALTAQIQDLQEKYALLEDQMGMERYEQSYSPGEAEAYANNCVQRYDNGAVGYVDPYSAQIMLGWMAYQMGNYNNPNRNNYVVAPSTQTLIQRRPIRHHHRPHPDHFHHPNHPHHPHHPQNVHQPQYTVPRTHQRSIPHQQFIPQRPIHPHGFQQNIVTPRIQQRHFAPQMQRNYAPSRSSVRVSPRRMNVPSGGSRNFRSVPKSNIKRHR